MKYRSLAELRTRRSELQDEIVLVLGQINTAEVRLGKDATILRLYSRNLLTELTALDASIAAGEDDNTVNSVDAPVRAF